MSHAFVRRPQNTQAGFLLITFFSCFTVQAEKGKKGYLKLRPVHAHVDSVIKRPPLEVLVVVGVVDCVVQLFVNLWQPKQQQHVSSINYLRKTSNQRHTLHKNKNKIRKMKPRALFVSNCPGETR